jgi:Zn-dependent protease
MSVTASIVVIEIGVLVPSVVLHEVAHGFVAYRCGDPTAKRAGRLTLNPIPHIDPVGSVLIPLLCVLAGFPAFGYAKPVPVSVNRLRKPRNQHVYVSLAGPLVNFILVLLAFGVCSVLINAHVSEFSNLFTYFLYLGVINLFLGVFNMLPIPPLDGSILIERLVPRRHLMTYFQLRRNALPVVMVLVAASYYFHWTDGAANWLVNQFYNRLPQ